MRPLLTLLLLLGGTTLASGAELRLLSGKMMVGELVSVSTKEVVFRATAGQVTTGINDVLSIEFQVPPAPAGGLKFSDVELIDGTLLHCGKFTLKGKQVELTLAGSDLKFAVPLAAISYLLNDAQDAALRQEWQDKFLAKRGNQDVLAVRLNDVLNGVDGTLGEGNDKGEIHFDYGGGTRHRDVDPSRIQGLLFVRSLGQEAPPPLCKVSDVYRNVYVAANVSLTPASFTVTTVSGAAVVLPRSQVTRLDYSNDKVVFLSDMKPLELIEKSKQGRKDNLRLDKNLDSGALQMKGEVYSKGLALHAYTEVVYNLGGKYAKFEGVLGMDDTVGGDGQPVVKIEGDGTVLFSGTINRLSGPQKIEKDVKGVKQLRIVVSSNGLFDFGDHVDLANAKLSK